MDAAVGRVVDSVLDSAWALLSCLNCGAGTSTVRLNGATYEIERLLGEGGFSLVYLVRDAQTGAEYALKKVGACRRADTLTCQIRCQHGAESLRMALAEIDAMRRFRGPHVIRLVDSCVMQEDDAGSRVLGNVPTHDEESARAGRVVYLVLPYFRRGNVQDAINAHVIQGTRFDEERLLRLFLGACEGVRTMHCFSLPHVPVEHQAAPVATPSAGKSDSDALLFDAEDAYPPATPMSATALGDDIAGERMPYAHRDIKPGYVGRRTLTQQYHDRRRRRHGHPDGLWQHGQGARADPQPARRARRTRPGGGALEHAVSRAGAL